MDIANASNGSPGSVLLSFIPLLLMGSILGILFKTIAIRKGRSQWLWFLAGFVPGWNLLGGLWLASLPDKSILEEVKALLNELQKFDFVPKRVQNLSISPEPQTWKCNCGMINEVSVPNCPQCGLKREFLLKHRSRP